LGIFYLDKSRSTCITEKFYLSKSNNRDNLTLLLLLLYSDNKIDVI